MKTDPKHIKDQMDKLNERGKYKRPKAQVPPLTKKYMSYMERSDKKKIPFELTIDQFSDILEKDCIYCGGPGGSVDRINSKGGYTIDNTQPCCVMCNMMKYTYTHDQFMDQIVRIYNHIGKL